MFSRIVSRLQAEANDLYRLRDSLLSRGVKVRDLISSITNEMGLEFPQDCLEEILLRGSRQCRVYRPDSFGQRSAREAVSEYYADRDVTIHSDSILLTPGTSLSYWYCFRLLADDKDEILCPQPSYPLFDYIAMLSGVRLIPYRLVESNGWAVDTERLEAGISTKTRAIVLISPHNPTGYAASSGEISRLSEIARRHDLAIICDEVFSEFLLRTETLPRAVGKGAPLVFTLNGFSKMFALPGMKFGWMAVSGEQDRVRQAMRALELMSDTFLPVNEIVQAAAPDIFRQGKKIHADFCQRIRECWDTAEPYLESIERCDYWKPDGGFYVTLNLAGLDEEIAANRILKENHILLHPGYFYDMEPNHLVLSYVQKPETIQKSLSALGKTLSGL